jgi:flagellar basal body-associated protein FliL
LTFQNGIGAKMKSSKFKSTLIILLVSIVLVVAGYLAADRYLIQHVEIQNVSAYVDSLAASTSMPTAQSTSTTSPLATSTALKSKSPPSPLPSVLTA